MGQHYVPQRYLRNFEDQTHPEFIWMYDKVSGGTRRVPIMNVAQARGYYEEDVEAELGARIEQPANPVMAKLCEGQSILSGERADLALYIAVMLKRVPYRRAKGFEMVPGVVDETVSEIRDSLFLMKITPP